MNNPFWHVLYTAGGETQYPQPLGQLLLSIVTSFSSFSLDGIQAQTEDTTTSHKVLGRRIAERELVLSLQTATLS